MTPDDTPKQDILQQEIPVITKEEPKKYIDIPFYPILKVDKLYAGLPIETSVPTDIDIEGKIKSVSVGGIYYLYEMIDGVWRKMSGSNYITVLTHSDLMGLLVDDHTQYILVDGTRAFTGEQSMGSNKLTHLDDPTENQDAATKAYVDGKVIDFAWLGHNLDGFTQTVAISGTINRLLNTTNLNVISNAGSSAKLYSEISPGLGGFAGSIAGWDLICYAKLTVLTRQNVFIGLDDGDAIMPSDHILTNAHCGFIVDDGTIWYSAANGATQTKDSIQEITLTNWNKFKVSFRYAAGSPQIYYYINDVLKMTVVSDYPAGSVASPFFGIDSTGTEGKTLSILHPYILKAILT